MNVFATQQFEFAVLMAAIYFVTAGKDRKLQKLLKLTNSFNF